MKDNIIYVDFCKKTKGVFIISRLKNFFKKLTLKNDDLQKNNSKGKIMVYENFRHIL